MLKAKLELKTKQEMEKIKNACRLASIVLEKLSKKISPNISAKYLNDYALSVMRSLNIEPAFLNYRGYPAAICVSVNHEIVHGLPTARKILREGDIVSIDLGVKCDGFYGDVAATFAVGKISNSAKRLIQVTREALESVLKIIRPGIRIGDIAHHIQTLAEKNGYNTIREYAGHGIGRNIHEYPDVPNYGKPNTGMKLIPGMVLAIEPMICEGSWKTKIADDGWTVYTKDFSLCAHFESVVGITDDGYELLTFLPDEREKNSS